MTVVWGLKVTVLCGLGEFEILDVGRGRSGDLSVDADAIVAGDQVRGKPLRQEDIVERCRVLITCLCVLKGIVTN